MALFSRNRALAAFAVVSALALPACRLSRAASRNFEAILSTPRGVQQNTHPTSKDARIGVVWIGHATALIQLDDKVILTDPVFTKTVGQLGARIVEPGMDPRDVPPIDAVLISHMHFDHLSFGSLEMIERKVRALLLPVTGTTYIPDSFSFPSWELETWQTWEKDGLRVTAVPVDHVGFRYGLDEAWMTHSFTGYVVEYHGLKVYFGGDSAYNQADFVATATHFPGLEVALIPIAPIEPRELMRRTHMDPREALQAFIDLKARYMVPIHYDTFVNSTDHPGDALRALSEAEKARNIGPDRFVTPLAIGERRVFVKVGEEPGPADAGAPDAEPPDETIQ